MNRFERWFLKRLLKQEVRQGLFHALRISALYQAIRDAARKEFYEDNNVTLDDFLHERFMATVSGDYAATHDGVNGLKAEEVNIRDAEIKQLLKDAERLGFTVTAVAST